MSTSLARQFCKPNGLTGKAPSVVSGLGSSFINESFYLAFLFPLSALFPISLSAHYGDDTLFVVWSKIASSFCVFPFVTGAPTAFQTCRLGVSLLFCSSPGPRGPKLPPPTFWVLSVLI